MNEKHIFENDLPHIKKPQKIEIKNFPDFDTYMKLLGFTFIKKASMCQGAKTTLIYKREKDGSVCQLIVKNDFAGSFLEGVNLEREHIKGGIS